MRANLSPTTTSVSSKIRRRIVLGSSLAALSAVVPASQFSGLSRRIVFVYDERWTTDVDVATVIHYAGGQSRLTDLGFVIETHYVHVADSRRLTEVCESMSASPPTLLVVLGDIEALALHTALSEVPMIYMLSLDPRGSELEGSMNRRGGQCTGVSFDTANFVKPLEFLSEIVGEKLSTVAIVAGSEWFSPIRYACWSAKARELHVDLRFVVTASYAELLENPSWRQPDGIDGFVLPMSLVQVTSGTEMVQHLNDQRIPAIFERFNAVVAGAALGYEDVSPDWRRTVGAAIGLVSTGVSPAEIPTRGPDNWEFAANLTALTHLNLTLSASALSRISRFF